MKELLLAVLLLTAVCGLSAQNISSPDSIAEPAAERRQADTGAGEAGEKPGSANPELSRSGPAAVPPSVMKHTFPVDYVRPNGQERFRRYIRNIAGPEAFMQYAATSALLTWRNTPKEWGAKPDGFARRLGNVAAKHVIKESVIYGLDEALKLDSSFYLSRDRGIAARLRNSVFSAVTARNRRGKRVLGVPRLAGSFASSVIASTQWYPSRYDHDHGLKGGAITIGVTAGVNLFREFVLKR